jgi:probable HAF family extracellular repeat protein
MKPVIYASLLAFAAFSTTSWAQGADGDRASTRKLDASNYQVHDLGSVQNGASYARALSTDGKAAGWASFNISGDKRPALFELGKLPTPIYTDGPGEATGVNADGEVVGWYWRGSTKQAFLWKNHQIQLLMSPIGGNSAATAINDRSEVVGWFEVSPGVVHGFHYFRGKLTDLGAWGGTSAQATGINKHGEIVGFREKAQGGQVVKQGVRVLQGRRPELVLPLTGFDNLVPTDINDQGEVAGSMWFSGRPYDFDTATFATRDGQVVNLQRPNCCFGTVGVALNKKGQVVGYNFDRLGDPHENMTLWDPKQGQLNLSVLQSARDQGFFQLTEGNDIDDKGVIVGAGVVYPSINTPHAVMLVPGKGKP